MPDENALNLLEKYSDELYRFAYILTCSDHGAADLLSEAFSELSGNDKFTYKADENRIILFSALYALAPKFEEAPDFELIKQRYGEKNEEFYALLKAPLRERARTHLLIYEDMTEREIEGVLKRK